MKKIIIVGIVIFALLGVAIYTGIIPTSLGLLDNGTDTKTYKRGDVYGNKMTELLDTTGYICSYRPDAMSEKVVVTGTLINDHWDCYYMVGKGWYQVYLKKNAWSDWDLVSSPGHTSNVIDNQNPGKFNAECGCKWGTSWKAEDEWKAPTYQFNIRGNEYSGGAIKVEFWAQVDRTVLDLTGYENFKMSSDEAYLYDGYSELILPTGINEEGLEVPYTTFEIGQIVKIGVGTGRGGHADNDLNWRVTLNSPYHGIDSPSDKDTLEDNPTSYGAIIEEQYFPDDTDASNTFFTFEVTPEMADLSMNSDAPFTIRIWNTLIPRGTINIDFVDFIHLCPQVVHFEGLGNKIKVGEMNTVQISADINSETQAPIDYIRVSIVYGTSNSLLPSTQSSERWILHTSNIGGADRTACSLPISVQFRAEKASYVTIFAKAKDIEGRISPSTKTYTVYAWKPVDQGGSGEPPDDAVDGETGEDYYGGGHTDPWQPWDPGSSNWEDWDKIIENNSELLVYIAMLIVVAIFGVVAYFFPIPGGMMGKIMVFMVGIAIAIVLYFLM